MEKLNIDNIKLDNQVEKDHDKIPKSKNSRSFFKLFVWDKKLDKNSFRYKFRYADIGNKALGVPFKDKSRILQRILNLFTTIFGINVLSFGFIGTFCFKFYGIIVPMPLSLLISFLVVALLIILRKIIAAYTGHLIKGK